MEGPTHVPVLLREVLEALRPERGGLYVDATLGLGGHAEAILDASPAVRLVGIDRDPAALAFAGERLGRFGERFVAVEGRHEELALHLDRLGISEVDGLLADLVAELPAEDLARIFRDYGEEPRAKAVARAIVAARESAPIRTTGELRSLVARAIGGRREEGRDPATRVFQALRIATNRELVELNRFLDDAISRLSLGARLAVLSYHSLEDRIVKDAFRERAAGCSCPPSFPVCVCSRRRVLALVTRKPVRPTPEEVFENRRSRSARLRVAERVAPGPPRSG